MEDHRSPRIYRIPYPHSQVLYVVYVSWTKWKIIGLLDIIEFHTSTLKSQRILSTLTHH